MKLLLASAGLANETIIQNLEEMVGKARQNINAIIINEAIKGESGDMRWFTEEFVDAAPVPLGTDYIIAQQGKLLPDA